MPTPDILPCTMRCIEVAAPGGPEALVVATAPVPLPAPGEVLIRVTAAGINRADLLQRKGRYPPPAGASTILGMEISGRIAGLGRDHSSRWSIGDPVCALVAGGGYAEYCTAPAGQCLTIPEGVSLIEAAGLPEAATTVWANLFQPRRLFPGDLCLIQGGTSGIGSMAIQMARCFGARVAATAGSDEKRRFSLDLGAEIAANYHNDWAAEIASWSRPHGIDVILDIVGGEYFAKHLALLAPDGRLVHIAFLGGSQATVDLRTVMSKRLLITGSTLRSRPVEKKSSLVSGVERNLWPLFAAGRLRPVVSKVFPLSRAEEAHRLMETGGHMGKLVLEMDGG